MCKNVTRIAEVWYTSRARRIFGFWSAFRSVLEGDGSVVGVAIDQSAHRCIVEIKRDSLVRYTFLITNTGKTPTAQPTTPHTQTSGLIEFFTSPPNLKPPPPWSHVVHKTDKSQESTAE